MNSAERGATVPTPQQLAGVIRGLDNACEYCDRTQAFDSARNIREAAAAIGLLRNSHAALQSAVQALQSQNEAQRGGLVEARRALAVAIKANWEGATDADVAEHLVIKKIDAAIRGLK